MEQNEFNQSKDTTNGQDNASQPEVSLGSNDPQKSGTSSKGVITLSVIIALVIGFGAGMLATEATGLTVPGVGETETSEQPEKEEETVLEVPENAQVINECAEKRGKQFVEPDNIPFGPVYGVWEGEITSVEYMLGKEDFLGGEDYLDVDLMGAKYDHMNVGLLSEGHAGYPEPHYHVDLFTISSQESEQITCE